MGAASACWGVCSSVASGTSCPAAWKAILWIAVPAAPPAQLGERQLVVGEGCRAPRTSRICSSTRRPLSWASAAKHIGLRVHVVGAGVHVQLAERCDRAHEVRLTRPDVESRRYTQNDGSAQPRRGGDHLAVPTGVNRQLLADPVGLAAVGTTCGPSGPPWPPLSAPRAAAAAGAQVVARHSRAGVAPRPLQLGLEQALNRLLPPPPAAAAARLARRGIIIGKNGTFPGTSSPKVVLIYMYVRVKPKLS